MIRARSVGIVVAALAVLGFGPLCWAQTTAPRSSSKSSASSAAKIDLNTAKMSQLEDLPGVTSTLAREIVDARPFKRVEDLKKLKGVTPRLYAELADHVQVNSTTGKRSGGRSSSRGKLQPGSTDKKININTATADELDQLPGIGPSRAELIIKARPFTSIEDIMKVKGIKQKEFGKIKDLITVK